MDNLKLTGYFQKGNYYFNTKNHKEKQKKFAEENDKKDFEIVITAVNEAQYFQHKYYRGILLPSVADYMGEKNLEYVHNFIIKKKFLFYKIENNNISVKKNHKKDIIFINDGENITGYLRSTGTLDYNEFDNFIKKVDNWLFIDLQYRVLPELQQESVEIKKAMKSNLFSEEVEIENESLFTW